jgi:hypothetical protein
MEQWKDIRGFEGYYQVSSFGRIRLVRADLRNQRIGIRKGSKSGRGYLSIVLRTPKGVRREYIHRLVALHYLANDKNLPTVNHINGNKLDNSVENLEWCSYADNNKHAVEYLGYQNSGEHNSMAKLSERTVLAIRKDYERGLTQAGLHKKYNLTRSHIHDLVKYKKWKHLKI